MTTTCPLDYSTVAIADKFGNLSLIRLPQSTNDDVEEDPTGTKSLWDRGLLSGAGQKAECIAVTHIGETIVSLTKAALIPGGSDSLVYTTLSGTVGMVVPFTSNEDHDFFQHLEMHMRGENPPMCGRYANYRHPSHYPIYANLPGTILVTGRHTIPARMCSTATSASNLTPWILSNRRALLKNWTGAQMMSMLKLKLMAKMLLMLYT